MADEEGAPVFKKPKRNRNIRKRSENDSAEGADEVSEGAVSLEVLRELQRQRQRTRGVSLAPTAGQGGGDEGGEQEDEEGHGLDSTFTAQSNEEVDPNMLKYIEEQMRREEAAAGDSSLSKTIDDEDGLYVTPAHLQGRLAPKEDNSELEDANRWLAGIMEVPISAEEKMAAIEETERAKRGMMAGRHQGKGKGPQMTIPSNFNANFHQHRRENAILKQSQGKGGRGGGGGPNAGRGRFAPATQTDGNALAQFRKNNHNRRNY
eukprot:CAMPEP_0183357086 /NCGR_PEP_ID=MMETSP0164_2-20130417/45371_1 /TAXON_ID=221442 /ORGANISM="Coccolithus pelagicus ssp braarudi, Strain PLY182g" /LENGTH=262 /DNA_ID=CAMNT_0025530637 /DNA_START=12 /DNA_END=800 /DNA_ORIENTATION=-